MKRLNKKSASALDKREPKEGRISKGSVNPGLRITKESTMRCLPAVTDHVQRFVTPTNPSLGITVILGERVRVFIPWTLILAIISAITGIGHIVMHK